MLQFTNHAGIIGIGLNIPEERRFNSYWDDIEILDSPKERERLFQGIDERRVFPSDILPSDAETVAAKRAIEDAGLSLEDINLVMVHSMLQDKIVPGNASLVQHKLGLKNAAAWNIDTCCSSFVTMFIVASHLIMAGTYKNVVIVTSVFHSRMIPNTNYLSPILGDGAAAVVLGPVSEGRGYMVSHAHSKGEYHDAFVIEEGIAETKEGVIPQLQFVLNDATVKSIGRNSVNDMKSVLMKALEKANIEPNEVDFMVTHQPGQWAHDAWRDSLGIPPSKSHQTFVQYGNIASASIPTSLYEARELGKLKDGDTVLMASSGAGENFSIALFRWGK